VRRGPPAETQIKITRPTSWRQRQNWRATRLLLRALRLCDLLLDAMAESETEAKRIGAVLDFDQDRHHIPRCRDNYQRLSDDIAQTAQLVLPKNRKRYTKDVEIQRSHRPRPLAQFSSLCRKLGRNATSSHTAEGLGVLFYLGPGQLIEDQPRLIRSFSW
jgi:hypothetical protein